MTRAGGLLSGPVPLVLRLLAGRGDNRRSANLRRWAAASAVTGSILTRFAWMKAGQVSARDPSVILAKPGERPPSNLPPEKRGVTQRPLPFASDTKLPEHR